MRDGIIPPEIMDMALHIGATGSVTGTRSKGTLFESSLPQMNPPPVIQPTVALTDIMPEGVYDALLSAVNAQGPSLAYEHYKACHANAILLNNRWAPQSKIYINNLPYCTRDATPQNSFVRYRLPSSNIVTGQIHHIFVHERSLSLEKTERATFIAIRQYQSLDKDKDAFNVYPDFPDLDGELLENRFQPGFVVISQEQISQHLAAFLCDVPDIGKCVATLPVALVGISMSTHPAGHSKLIHNHLVL